MAMNDKNDLDKTQYMGNPGTFGSQVNPPKRNLEDTQSLPRLSEDTEEIKPAFPKQVGRSEGVRELAGDPMEFGGPHKPPRKGKKSYGGLKKFLLLGAGFLLALTLGFALAGWSQDQSAAKEQQRQEQEAQLLAREQKLLEQEADLKEERERLTRQKQALEAHRQEGAEKPARLQGQNDRLAEEGQKPGLGRLLDRMTGKEQERREALEANNRQSAQLDDEAASVKQSIAQAQAMLEELDQRIDDVQAMQREAGKLRDKVESAYEENRGNVDQIVYYVQQGAEMLQSLLDNK